MNVENQKHVIWPVVNLDNCPRGVVRYDEWLACEGNFVTPRPWGPLNTPLERGSCHRYNR